MPVCGYMWEVHVHVCTVHMCMQGVHMCWHVGACVSLILYMCSQLKDISGDCIAGCGIRVPSGSASLLSNTHGEGKVQVTGIELGLAKAAWYISQRGDTAASCSSPASPRH